MPRHRIDLCARYEMCWRVVFIRRNYETDFIPGHPYPQGADTRTSVCESKTSLDWQLYVRVIAII